MSGTFPTTIPTRKGKIDQRMGTFSTTILSKGRKYNGNRLEGLNPAPVTLFKDNGDVDFEANARLAKWLASIDGVKSLVILGHAGEGTFLTHDEQLELIRVYKDATSLPVVAGITGEGTRVADEAKEKYDAGAPARWSTRTTAGCASVPEGRAEVPLQEASPSPASSASCSSTRPRPRPTTTSTPSSRSARSRA